MTKLKRPPYSKLLAHSTGTPEDFHMPEGYMIQSLCKLPRVARVLLHSAKDTKGGLKRLKTRDGGPS